MKLIVLQTTAVSTLVRMGQKRIFQIRMYSELIKKY
jgi:hypothetical protein